MAKATGTNRPHSPKAAMRNFMEKFTTLTRRHRPEQVFTDFAEMSAIALSNPIDKVNYDKREARYIQVYKAYDKLEDRVLFPEMLADLIRMMEFGLDDVFQKIWVATEMTGNKRLGQHFTPYHLSKMMATMSLGNAQETIDRQGFIQASEPCCGCGGMIVATADALLDQGINYQEHLHVTAVDLDPLCVHMTYVQCSLYGIPALIYQGNSLTDDMSDQWVTVMHVAKDFDQRLRTRRMVDAMKAIFESVKPTEDGQTDPVLPKQTVDERWSQANTAERLRLVTEAGVEDLDLVLNTVVPDKLHALLQREIDETAA